MLNLMTRTEREKHDDTADLAMIGTVIDRAMTNVAPEVISEMLLRFRIALCRGPIGDIAFSNGATGAVVAANVVDESLSIFMPASGCAGGRVDLPGQPVSVVVTDDRAFVATGTATHDAVSAIDLETKCVLATYPLAYGVTALAASPGGERVYVGQTTKDCAAITVIDTVAESASTLDIGYGPAASVDAIAVESGGESLYVAVTDVSGSRLAVVDSRTSRVQRVVVVGAPIRDIAHAGDTIYVLTSDRSVGGAVHVIDLRTHRVTDTVTVGGAPTQLAMSPDHSRAYIVDYDRVAVLCTSSLEIVDSLNIGARPSCVALSADGSQLLVADFSGAVQVFSVESSVEMLYAHLLATDPIVSGGSPARELQPAP